MIWCWFSFTANCSEYGVGEVSECTEGFPSLFHINKVADNIILETKHERQVLIPNINFTCNGFITKWIFGAKWDKKSQVHSAIELQIWRRNSTTENTYTKVNETTVVVGTKNNSEVYVLETSLAFQEGDILGYFQPKKDKSKLNLYLEKSDRITTYHQEVDSASTMFAIDDSTETDYDTRYPLITVRTGRNPQLV